MSKEDLPQAKVQRYGPAFYRAAVRTAFVAAAFCLVVAGALIAEAVRTRKVLPLRKTSLAALRKRLARNPQDRELESTLRREDLLIRETYVRHSAFARRGARLLLGGSAVLLTALLCAVAYRKKLPAPQQQSGRGDEEKRAATLARWSVTIVAIVLLGAGLRAALVAVPLSRPSSVEPPATTPRPSLGRWPRFRGPGGRGVSPYTSVPTSWDGATGKGIIWKKPVPLPGNNSPIAWDYRVFVSGADKTRREVYCFDAYDGKMLWRRPVRNVPGSPKGPPQADDFTGYAAPTMATDGRRVYAMFANGDVVAFNLSGKKLWAHNLDNPKNRYGHANSLATYKSLLIVQFDQGDSAEDGLSRVLALNGPDGKTVWETPRPVRDSWSSPIIIESAGRDQLITCAEPWVIAYEPATGKEIWKADCLSGDIGPCPTYADGLVFACNEGANLVAIRPTGRGDVTKTHVVFKVGEYLPDMVSPLSTGDLVFLVKSNVLSCYGVKEKKQLWEHDKFDDNFVASPTLVGDKVYLMDEKGVMHIFRVSREKYVGLATAKLGERAHASPAFVKGRIYIRGEKHLFCIGKTDGGS